MAFRATNQIPEDGYRQAKVLAINIKNRANAARLAMASDVDFDFIWNLRKQLFEADLSLAAVKIIPGIVAYAVIQEDDVTYAVATEFNALQAAVDDARTEIDTALPANGGGFLLVYKIGLGTVLDPRTFTTVQTATIQTKLQAIEDAVV